MSHLHSIARLSQDFRFGNVARPYWSYEGEDINMQIPDEIRKCVVFLAYRDQKVGEYNVIGTGFLFSVESSDKMAVFSYLVTCRHVIAKVIFGKLSSDDRIWVRINKRGGGFDYLPVPLEYFKFHPRSDISIDVAVARFFPAPKDYDYLTIPSETLLTPEIIRRESIGIGDEVFMTGLFKNYFGEQKNIPILRVGNLSAMPDEPIKTREFGMIEGAYLVELRSIGGLSGSPVFVHLSQTRVRDGRLVATDKFLFYLLGILHGHWDLESALSDAVTEDYPVQGRDKINTGIGIVVPCLKISEVLLQPFFVKEREENVRKREEERFPTMD